MSANRLYYALGAIALLALLTLAARAVLRASAPRPVQRAAQPAQVQSLAKEIEGLQNSPIDSATTSFGPGPSRSNSSTSWTQPLGVIYSGPGRSRSNGRVQCIDSLSRRVPLQSGQSRNSPTPSWHRRWAS